VIQPILVRQLPAGNYEIVAGERRWRASQLAGLDEVPVVVRELEDRTVIAMALIENIQREDLNPLEEAEALQRLISEFTLTHAEAAEAVGARARRCPTCCACWSCRWRSACCWKPAAWKWATPALLTLAPELAGKLAQEAADEGWSVREVERRAQASPPARCRATARWPRRRCSRPTSPRWKPNCPKHWVPRWRSTMAAAARAS
jgi:ParB family chromosome partitioning protein